MAQTTLKHLVIAPLTTEADGAAPVYGTGMKVGHLIQANISWNRGNTKLFGDDKEVARDNSATSGTLTVNTTYLDRAARVALLDIRAAGGSATDEYYMSGDEAPYVGVGYVWKDNLIADKPFIAYWYYKVQFAMNEDMQTKGENIEYGTPTIEGEVMAVRPTATLETHFREEKDFATEAAAITWLNTKAGIT